MNNFVLLYRFDDKEQERSFEQGLAKDFPRHKMVTDAGFKYFGFASKSEPGVVDVLDGILNGMGIGVKGNFGQRDYVALYFSREKDPDNVKRQLLIGTDEMVNKDAETMSADAHRNAIINLLKYDFLKAEQQKK
ncbi:hypothetical protein [Pontibacter ruber]|uniref:Uncharacterized protein n=1 Tax=Pontibacter ruber TaxID=1343895 RepID=A0ABW5CRS8_9BACT|nr:hypothetical protein [Pontibacter ruber]